jgi:homoserine dehydrogenase
MTRDKSEVIVLKFGSSVLRNENDLPIAVTEIRRWRGNCRQVIAIVSAFGDTTDKLLGLARSVCQEPEEAALAILLASGEATSSALLGLALGSARIPTCVLDPAQAGLRTTRNHLDADLVAVDEECLRAKLRDGVVVLPGFIGRDENGDTTLLGRGGSDYSALFLAHRLAAACVLLKDVDGLYTSDPANNSISAVRFAQAGYDTALRIGGSLVQQKAVRFAAARRQHFFITSIGAENSTEVGPFVDQLDSQGLASSFNCQETRLTLQECAL